jgi:anti-sigma factor RsiW
MDMTNHSDWIERLSPYLDGELEASERSALEAHLGGCATCRGALDDLRQIVAVAPGYQGREPGHDLWPLIEAEIDQRRGLAFPKPGTTAGVRRHFSLGQLLAASVAFLVIGAGSAYLVSRTIHIAPTAVVAGPTPELSALPVAVTAKADSAYDLAVSDLQSVLARGRGKLDTATVRVIEENLALIDRAIAQAREAIAKDPANAYLNSQVAANMRRKLNLLRQAAAAVTASES